MSIIDDCVQFLEDLILGDFNENQQVSAQVIGGLISLIPIVDQVMDVRDISGNLYRINKQGGFAKATLDQKIDFGFAAFGVVPEIGSAFKTVFKPLYKQRKAMKGVMNGGVAMIERMLGKKKGGAVKWVKGLDWAGNTQLAIYQADMALNSCIELLDYIAQGHWWCPDHLEQLARDVSPGLRSLRGKLAAPIREAVTHIRAFLEDMLGEHAAAVALAVAGNAGSLRHTTGKAGNVSHSNVVSEKRVKGKKNHGTALRAVQMVSYEGYKALNYAVKGLLGEHIVDHYVIEHSGWGLGHYKHDLCNGVQKKAGIELPRKLNDNGIPIHLCTPSEHVLTSGIDSLWLTNRTEPKEYAVVEAKANMNPQAKLLNLLGEANDTTLDEPKPVKKKGVRNSSKGGGTSSPARGLDKTSSKSKCLQMSHTWIMIRVNNKFRSLRTKMTRGLNGRNYSRHVFLVTPIQAAEHIISVNKILSEKLISNPVAAQKYAHEHAVHNVQKEFGEHDLDLAEKSYRENGRIPRKTQKRR